MSGNKKVRETAKRLLQLSMKDDDLVPEQVDAVLQSLDKHPPRNYRAILREYLRQVRKQVARSRAIVEYAGELPAELLNSVEAELSAHYARPITAVTRENKDLIAGWRIHIDSDVYDASVAMRLNQLAKATSR